MRRIRRLPVYAAVVLTAAGASVAGVWAWRRDTTAAPAAAAPSTATAEIVRQDLSTSVSVTGKLGYGVARSVKGSRPGIVTWLPSPGATIRRGSALYRVDDEPVPVFYGRIPLYRRLEKLNTVGRDVRVVADNLEALGYAVGRRYRPGDHVRQTSPVPLVPEGGAPSAPPASRTSWVKVGKGEDVLTTALVRAVGRWQNDIGLPASGSLGIGDVAVLGGAVRVESTAVQVGDSAEAALLAVTPTVQVVTIEAEPAEANGMKRGEKVQVHLPDDRTVPGRVSRVATAVTTDPDTPPKLTVTVTLDDARKTVRLDAAPVEVVLPGRSRNDVLVTPVGALVALAEGGYAVQVAGGGLVAVETGMFAGGLVEVSGAGLSEGTLVVTTS
ncbi:HlyD family efflux transporter periplasmic adaptor subunit [Actinoplanes friuliensis]|uniref:HlyD family efflux transporter periplasmic adaptor subunit n=1 Tax=Actinoplanes friuliensis TaxID=196914 RepID=UPI0007C4998C|nr:HlyD family efflux transporter periplasmic adaptor subunit [Actinoplanes friuliensis]